MLCNQTYGKIRERSTGFVAMSKRKKHNLQWLKETQGLKEDHNWKSKPGTQIFVAGRGALRFDVPDDWHFEPDTKSFRFLDRKPPNDDCRLEASFNLLPPGNWADFPLVRLLKQTHSVDRKLLRSPKKSSLRYSLPKVEKSRLLLSLDKIKL